MTIFHLRSNSNRKHIIVSLIALAGILNPLIAQDNRDLRGRLILGVKAGINYSTVYNSSGNVFIADPKVGFAGGAFLAIPIGIHFGLQPEVIFSQKGFKSTGILFNSGYYLTRTTNYLDIPLFFAIKPVPFLTLLAGPQYSYLISQKNSFKNGTTTMAQEKEFDKDQVRKNTFCLATGVDINIWHVVVGARAGIDLRSNNGNTNSLTPHYKNVWYQFTIGYRIYQP